MVGDGRPPGGLKPRALGLGLPSRRRVEDRGAAAGSGSAQRLGEERVHVAGAAPPPVDLGGPQRQVGTGEALDDLGRVGRESEPGHDLVADDRRRGGGAGEDARRRELGQDRPQLEVLRPEVVAPFADAVGLVHGDQGADQAAKERPEPGVAEPLGGDVGEGQPAGPELAEATPHLGRIEGRGKVRGGDAALLERANLVLHEGDERRDDQRGPAKQRGGELVGEALAAAGRGDEEQAPDGEQPLDRLPLPGTEVRMTQPTESGVEVEPAGFRDRLDLFRHPHRSLGACRVALGCHTSWSLARTRPNGRPDGCSSPAARQPFREGMPSSIARSSISRGVSSGAPARRARPEAPRAPR